MKSFEIVKDGSNWAILEDGVFIGDFNTKAEAEACVRLLKQFRNIGN